MPTPSQAERGPLALLLANAPFRRLFLSRVVSLFGDWFNTIAVLALLRDLGELGASSFAWVLVLKLVPGLLVAPHGGALIDRVSRKRLLVALDLVRALLVGLLIGCEALAGALGLPPALLLYLLVALQSGALALADPAHQALLPDVVRADELVAANTLLAATWSAMLTLGTAAGGLVTAAFGWQVALCVDLGTYGLSAVLLLGLVEPPAAPRAPGLDVRFREGLRFLAARPRLWTLALAKTGWAFAGGITLVLTVLGERAYPLAGQPILGVTCLYVARGIGTALGPFLARGLSGGDPARAERLIGQGFLLAAALYLALGLVDHLALAAALVLLAHLGGSTVWTFSTVRLQQLVPSEVRGRVFSAEAAAWKLSAAISTLGFAALIDSEVAPLSLVASAVGLILLVPGALWALRQRALAGEDAQGRDPDPPDGAR